MNLNGFETLFFALAIAHAINTHVVNFMFKRFAKITSFDWLYDEQGNRVIVDGSFKTVPTIKQKGVPFLYKLSKRKPLTCLYCLTGWCALILALCSGYKWESLLYCVGGLFIGGLVEAIKMRWL